MSMYEPTVAEKWLFSSLQHEPTKPVPGCSIPPAVICAADLEHDYLSEPDART